jgi:phenylacetate-CoA ligase
LGEIRAAAETTAPAWRGAARYSGRIRRSRFQISNISFEHPQHFADNRTMRLDFSPISLKEAAFSEAPMTFVDQEAKGFLSRIMDIAALETGNPAARARWQQTQLQNLLAHAARRSPFWKARIGAGSVASIRLAELPIQTRADVARQMEAEGVLIGMKDQIKIKKHSTSGSSGTPVQFFITEWNSAYNATRGVAQHFMEGRDFLLNRTRIHTNISVEGPGFTVKKSDTWLAQLRNLIRTGINKHIDHSHPDIEALCEELERDKMGYYVGRPLFFEPLLQHVDIEFFKRAGLAMVISMAETMPPELRALFRSADIPVRANYSSEEVGWIAAECDKAPEHFHVSTSNVIVEVVADETIQLNGRSGGRVLVTHLHSYATPFIRYDIGDVATLDQHCPCGYEGPVLTNIYGRAKALIKHADGHLSIFHVRAKEMIAVAGFEEFRIRQTDLKTMVVEIGGRTTLAPKEIADLTALIKRHAGKEFDVRIKPVAEIDWGPTTKRLGFYNEVLRS